MNKFEAEIASPTAKKPPPVKFDTKGKQPRKASHLASRLQAFPKPAADKQLMPGLASIPNPLASNSRAPTAPARRLQTDHASLAGTASLGSADVSSADPQAADDEQRQLEAASQLLGLSKGSTSEKSVHEVQAPIEEQSQAKRAEAVESKTSVTGLDQPRPGLKGACLDPFLFWQCMCLRPLSLAECHKTGKKQRHVTLHGQCHDWHCSAPLLFKHCIAWAKVSVLELSFLSGHLHLIIIVLKAVYPCAETLALRQSKGGIFPVKPTQNFVFNGDGNDSGSQPAQQQSTGPGALAVPNSSAALDAAVKHSPDVMVRGINPTQEQNNAPGSSDAPSFFRTLGNKFEFAGVASRSSQATQLQRPAPKPLASTSTPGALAAPAFTDAQKEPQHVSTTAVPSPGSFPFIPAKARAVGGARRRLAGRSKHNRRAAAQQNLAQNACAAPEGTGPASAATPSYFAPHSMHAPASGT